MSSNDNLNKCNEKICDSDDVLDIIADAETGDANAQYALGCHYITGHTILKKDSFKAMEWLKKSADQGHAKAKVKLAELKKVDS